MASEQLSPELAGGVPVSTCPVEWYQLEEQDAPHGACAGALHLDLSLSGLCLTFFSAQTFPGLEKGLQRLASFWWVRLMFESERLLEGHTD